MSYRSVLPRMSSTSLTRPSQTQWSLLGCVALCLMLSGCSGIKSFLLPPEQTSCYVPADKLQQTLEPPLNDATNEDLLREANQVRSALQACNRDKASALELLTLQNQLRDPKAKK